MKSKNIKVSNNRQMFLKGDEIQIKETPQINLPNVDEEDTIENMFKQNALNSQNDVKEIFGEDKVKARTDLSTRQIKLITKAFYLAEISGMKEIHHILHDFMTLSISKDRKSRNEYVEGLKAKIDNAIQGSGSMLRGQFAK